MLVRLTQFLVATLLAGVAAHTQAITIDGKLDDSEWAQATVVTDFVTVTPFSLEPADYHTTARFFTDEDGIYIGITNQQPLATQKSERSSRDGMITADSNTVIIDFDNSAISGYHFEVANGGSMVDGIWRDENAFSSDWDGIWLAQTSSDSEHWYSEVFIPWDVAPMVSVEEGRRTIGLHFSRYVASNSKFYANAPINDSRQRFLSAFENFTIEDFATSSLQTFAYATARDNRVEKEYTYDVGVDIFWKPSSNKQLSLTINPDFGQVEADDIVVNFSPEETFFSENRPFFTENQSLFDMSGSNNLRILHTRRIGSKPDVGTELAADIIGALKYTSVNDKFSYGFISAVEDSDSTAAGKNFYVGRVLRKADDYSLGYMVTYTDRPDIDRDATVHASDYSYNFNTRFKVRGQVIYSDVNTATAQYSDAGGWAAFSHQITDNWNQGLELRAYGDELEINDAGYLSRNGLKALDYFNSKQRFDFSSDNPLQELSYGFGLFYSENSQGERLNSSIRFNTNYTFKNTANGFAVVNFQSGGVDDLITRGNGSVNTDSGVNVTAIYFADRRSQFQWHVNANYFDHSINGNGYSAHFHPSYRFNDRYMLQVGFTYTDSDDWLLWQNGAQLNTFAREQLLTEIDFIANISAKQEFTIKFEWVALQAQGNQAFLVNSSGDLQEVNTPVDDFNLSIVGLQLRYRYEIAPLSNVYVVYSRGGSTATEEDSFGTMFTPGWDDRDGDNIIVKLRYQF